MKPHIINIHPTNNPNIIKFTSNQLLTQGSNYQYNNINETKEAPLPKKLFHLPFVSKVFISTNFIAIEKFDIIDWQEVQEDIKELIALYLNQGNPVVLENAKTQKFVTEIYAESTPNPNVMKFVSNRLLSEMDFEYKNVESAKNAPMALEFFKFDFVKEIYIARNHISITKKEEVIWDTAILNELRSFIKNYLEAGKLIVDFSEETKNKQQKTIDIQKLEGTSLDIANILETYVKPAVASDGGNIIFQNYNPKTQIVSVILQGACSGCPSSTITLKNGIETMLKEMLPNKIHSVVAING